MGFSAITGNQVARYYRGRSLQIGITTKIGTARALEALDMGKAQTAIAIALDGQRVELWCEGLNDDALVAILETAMQAIEARQLAPRMQAARMRAYRARLKRARAYAPAE